MGVTTIVMIGPRYALLISLKVSRLGAMNCRDNLGAEGRGDGYAWRQCDGEHGTHLTSGHGTWPALCYA